MMLVVHGMLWLELVHGMLWLELVHVKKWEHVEFLFSLQGGEKKDLDGQW